MGQYHGFEAAQDARRLGRQISPLTRTPGWPYTGWPILCKASPQRVGWPSLLPPEKLPRAIPRSTRSSAPRPDRATAQQHFKFPRHPRSLVEAIHPQRACQLVRTPHCLHPQLVRKRTDRSRSRSFVQRRQPLLHHRPIAHPQRSQQLPRFSTSASPSMSVNRLHAPSLSAISLSSPAHSEICDAERVSGSNSLNSTPATHPDPQTAAGPHPAP